MNKEYYAEYVLDNIASLGNEIETYGIEINDFDTIDQDVVLFTRMNCFVFKETKFLLIDQSNSKMFIYYHDK